MSPVSVLFLHAWARALVVMHAIAALALAGSTTHSSIIAFGMLRGRPHPRLSRIYALVSTGAYLVTVALGALAYPTYRYEVRGLYLDRYAVWASNLFDMKESFAALGLPLILGACGLRLFASPDENELVRLPYALMVMGATAIVWFATISGLLIALEKGM